MSSSARRASMKAGPTCCSTTWRKTRGSLNGSSPWSCTRAACSCPRTAARSRSSSTRSIASISMIPTWWTLAVVPDFPCSREDAIQLAKRQRVEVRILVVGLRIAGLRQKRDWLGLLGKGILPAEMSFKNTIPGNGGVALGAVFGMAYAPTLVDVDLWANIRQARLDVIQSQLDLEKSLIDVANDAGNSWDRWQQAIKEWEQREKELALRRELFERQERLYEQKQSFPVEVLGTRVNLLQADANRWTAWYNLQLARLDVLRATELLLDYVEKAGIAHLPSGHEDPEPGFWKHRLAWLRRSKSNKPLAQPGTTEPWRAGE